MLFWNHPPINLQAFSPAWNRCLNPLFSFITVSKGPIFFLLYLFRTIFICFIILFWSSVLKSERLECRFYSFCHTVDYFVQIDSADKFFFSHDLSLHTCQKACLPSSFLSEKCGIQLKHLETKVYASEMATQRFHRCSRSQTLSFVRRRLAFALCSTTSSNHFPALTQNTPDLLLKWKRLFFH